MHVIQSLTEEQAKILANASSLLSSEDSETVKKSIISLQRSGISDRDICTFFFWLIEDKAAPYILIQEACKKYHQTYSYPYRGKDFCFCSGGTRASKQTGYVDEILSDSDNVRLYYRLMNFYENGVKKHIDDVLVAIRGKEVFKCHTDLNIPIISDYLHKEPNFSLTFKAYEFCYYGDYVLFFLSNLEKRRFNQLYDDVPKNYYRIEDIVSWLKRNNIDYRLMHEFS